MGWSYRYKADDQLYADDEHGPTVFDPGASIGVPGSGNVISVGIPISGQLAQWTDPTHIVGITVIPTSAIPALTGDVTVAAGTNITAYANPVPASKAGLPTGGGPGQVLVKNSGTNFDTGWATGGGDVVAVPTPTVGQLAIWTDAHHVQGVAALPAANFPSITGDIVIVAGALIATYNNAVPPAKAGLPLGGSTGQVLSKVDNTNFNTTWINPPVTGGNVSNSGAPQGGQIALWTDATHISGVNTLPTASGGVPPGGTAGQVLAKNTNANFDSGWTTPAPGGGSPGGTDGQFQYNVAGAFAGVSNIRVVLPGSGTIAAALVGATTGLTLQLVGGTYVENAGVILPNGVHLQGAGMDVTVIQSSLSLSSNKGIIKPGNGSLISHIADLSILGTIAEGGYQAAIGDSTGSSFNIVLRNVRAYATSDSIYTDVNTGDLTAYNCIFESRYDVIGWGFGGTSGKLTLVDCQVIASAGASYLTRHWGIYGDGVIEMYGGRISVTGAYTKNEAFVVGSVGNVFKIHNVVIERGASGAGGGASWDIDNPGGAADFRIQNVVRLDGAALAVNGTVTHIDYAPSGGGGGDLNYVHNQVAPAASWAITHNLAKFPSVSVVDSGLNLIMPDVHYVDNNNLSLSFGASTSGKAYLN